MIQRIQSIFLAVALLFGALTFVFPVAEYQRGDQGFQFRTMGLVTAEGQPVVDATTKVPFGILIGVCALAYGVLIFLYRNRPRQIRVAGAVNLVMMALVVFLFITDRSIQTFLEQGGKVAVHYGASMFLPVGMMICGFLAVRAIRKDEQLVRSMDRLR